MIATKAATLHASVLISCSAIGIVGYYLQHRHFQITACIPATVGITLLVLSRVSTKSERARSSLLFVIALAFGIVVTRLALRFVFQEFQPLRKRIYFPAMALSSMVTCIAMLRERLGARAR